MACNETAWVDIITPGTSTVDHIQDNNYCEFARLQTVSNTASINALIMSCLFTHPGLLTCRGEPTKRLGVCWGMESIGMRRMGTPNQIIPASKVQIYSRTKERKRKKMLKKKQAELSFYCSDILSDKKNYYRNVTATGLTESRTSQIGSYFIITFKYRLNKQLW